jgi:hypothetical protein
VVSAKALHPTVYREERTMSDLTLDDGTILGNVHEREDCEPDHCCIHNPSDHPLREASLSWLRLGEKNGVMGRRCAHGFWHPDPDALAHLLATLQWALAEAVSSVHLMREKCDGCCQRELVSS